MFHRRRRAGSPEKVTDKNGSSTKNARGRRRLRKSTCAIVCFVAVVSVSAVVDNLSKHPPLGPSVKWQDFQQDYERRYKKPPPASLKQWLAFAISQNCETMKFYDAIERDLAPFQNRSLRYKDVTEEPTHNLFVAFEVSNNKLSFTHLSSRMKVKEHRRVVKRVLKWLLKPLVKHKPPIHTRVVWNLDDGPTGQKNAKFPVFSSCHASRLTDNLAYTNSSSMPTREEEYITRDLLVPFHFGIGYLHRGLWFWPFYSRGPAWENRLDTIVWRGSTTGKWGDAPRFWLMEQYGGSNINEIVTGVKADFAFVNVRQSDDGHDLPENYRRGKYMSYRQIQQHKYILDVDGNAFTERFPKVLRSGSLVFKSTAYREWFSERLRPWVDYVPVNYDLSDLKEKLEWARTHQALAHRIAEHGRETVERRIRLEDQQCYTYRLFLEYHELFKLDKR